MKQYQDKCQTCGYLLTDFLATGMLGCPDCYFAFLEKVSFAIEKTQKGQKHTGKTLEEVNAEKQLIEEYHSLIKEKEKAGINGKFTVMSKLSARLYTLSEELKDRGIL